MGCVNAKLGAGSKIEISVNSGTTFVQINGITDLGATGASKSEVDVTPLESLSKCYIAGVDEGDSKSITFLRDVAQTGQNLLKTNAVAGNTVLARVTYSNGEVATFDLVLLGWSIDAPTQTSGITGTVNGRISGDITWS